MRLIWLALVVLGLAASTWAFRDRFVSPVAAGDLLGWTEDAQKEQAAALLNRTVLIRDFRAEVHVIAVRENFWLIAKRYKINIDTVLAFNPELEGLDADLNQPLLLPNMRGALHQVKAGDTLKSIAALYSSKPDELKPADIKKANRVGWLGIKPLQLLFIPGAKPKLLSATLGEVYKKRSVLRSPLNGRYTSLMGSRSDPFTGAVSHHNGVDIKAAYNEPVSAAANGTVIFAGWNGGFGKCVKVDHHNGYVTLYGHLNSILVHTGQQIKQFQVLGKVGSTGRATGPHLHFTIYYNGVAKNPLEFLW